MTDFLLMVSGAVFAMFISGIVNYKKSAWVGLTDEHIWQLATDCTIGGDLHADKFARAIEAKLKEKNT
jgi:hypothetical protein